MTVVVKSIRSNPTAGARTRLYTVPAGKRVILRQVTYSTNDPTTRMGMTINGVGFIWDENTVTNSNSKTFSLSTVLYENDYLECESTTGNSFFSLQVAEMDNRDGPTLSRVTLQNFSASGLGVQTYTVPTGKRFRIREVHCAQHNTSGNVNVYIGGVGYVYRRYLTAHRNEVVQTDLSVNAGENFSASGDSGLVVHCFASGVLEDA